MIDERLIGKWWVFNYSGVFAMYKGNTQCELPSCSMPKDAETKWWYPYENKGNLGPIVLDHKYPLSNNRIPIDGLTIPPAEYFDEDTLTEIEILKNGDYRIFDSQPMNNIQHGTN